MSSQPSIIGLALSCLLVLGCSERRPELHYPEPVFIHAQAQNEAHAFSGSDSSLTSPTAGEALPENATSQTWAPVEDGMGQDQGTGQRVFAQAMTEQSLDVRAASLDRAAELGSGKAHYELAKIYTEGKVRPRNLVLAQEHLQAAAALDDPEATRVIGWQMIKGSESNQQNLLGGVAIMEMGAAKSVRAQRELGMLYANLYEDFKLNDLPKGESYLQQAYAAGDVQSATALGRLYIKQGRQLDAIPYLAFAADNKDLSAARLLKSLDSIDGAIGEAPRQVVQSGPTAESYYMRGNDIMLRKHTFEEEAKAYALFSLASDMGHNLAKVELAAIEGVNVQMRAKEGDAWLQQAKATISASN